MTEPVSAQLTQPAAGWKRVAIVVALFLFVSTALSVWWVVSYCYSITADGGSGSALVYIPKGSSVKKIGEILEEAGLIDNDIRFPLVAKLSGESGRLLAGEFRLTTGQTVLDTLRALSRAKPVQHKITLREGLTGKEMAELFAEKGFCDSRSYLNLMTDKGVIEKSGLGEIASLEGYLFPDTYYVTRDQKKAEFLIQMQVRRFKKVWEDLAAQNKGKLSRHELVTLASMVEKETGAAGERPVIAGVFYNRLEKKMRLQSDPTVVYGVEGFNGKITKKDLQAKTPYNTYVIKGLPVGPIANPGRKALLAAIEPQKTEFLYFVSKNDGTHQFSKSLREHNRAVKKFQRNKKVENSKEN